MLTVAMSKDWEPPPDADLPEGELEEIVKATKSSDAMLAERALEAMLGDDEDTVAVKPSAEAGDDGDNDGESEADERGEDDDEPSLDSDDSDFD